MQTPCLSCHSIHQRCYHAEKAGRLPLADIGRAVDNTIPLILACCGRKAIVKTSVQQDMAEAEPAWQQTVNTKREARDEAIAPFLTQVATKTDDSITSIADIEELATRIANKEFRSEDVVSAYVRKSASPNALSTTLSNTLAERRPPTRRYTTDMAVRCR
jgi:hypothetical protein